MTDSEREQVGTCYRQHGQKAAIDLGHQLVQGDVKAERTAAWADFAKTPIQRVRCIASRVDWVCHTQQWLHESGIEYPRVKGGYKSLRRWLIEYTDQTFASATLLFVGGRTGAAKTRVLNEGNAGQPIPRERGSRGTCAPSRLCLRRRTTEQPHKSASKWGSG